MRWFTIFMVASVFVLLAPPTRAQDAPSCENLPWDASVTYSVNQWGTSGTHTAAAVISDALLPLTLGIPVGLYAYGYSAVGKPNEPQHRYAAESGLQLLVTELVTYGVVYGLKTITDRERPFNAYPDCIDGYQDPLGSSMPSGHSAGAAALATTLSLRYPEWYVIAPSVAYALLTGASRLHLGVHYITDVLVGYALGVGTALLMNSVNAWLFEVADPILPSVSTMSLSPTFNVVSITIPL